MSNIYEKYFAGKDYYEAIAKVLYDIKENRIPTNDVKELTEELVNKNLIPESSNFIKYEKSKWNKEYLFYLMNGGGAGKISRDYLVYFAEVSAYVAKKRLYTALSAVVIVATIVWGVFFITR